MQRKAGGPDIKTSDVADVVRMVGRWREDDAYHDTQQMEVMRQLTTRAPRPVELHGPPRGRRCGFRHPRSMWSLVAWRGVRGYSVVQ